jgi:nitrogen fixation/metabolism regulation signal transduction histidine kinase
LLVLLAAAELWAFAVQLLRAPVAPAPVAGGVQVGLALLALIAINSSTMQRAQDRLALERLRTELAPLTLEQEFRRELALLETMRHVAEYFEELDDDEITAFDNPSRLAYYFWSTSELFFGGYKSALGLYSPAGSVVSYFSFDLPPFPVEWGDLDRELQLEAETLPGVGFDLELMHAEMPINRDGELIGVIVGHVLDEPNNLPFLPWSKPYLSALGAQLPWEIGSDAGDPQYVLYDEFGTVLLTTLPQPPGETTELRRVAESSGLVELTAGDEPHVGVALTDRGLLHLLLVGQRDLIERLAATARLALLGLALLLTLRLLPALLRPGGVRSFVHRFRQYYYRKLLAALLVAAVVPLVMLSLFLGNYIQRRGDQELIETATQFVAVAQRVLEDYTAVQREEQLEAQLDDTVLHWLRRVVGQEIHVYQNGRLRASSKRELFSSGLLPLRLDGSVRAELIEEGRPYLVRNSAIGAADIPVAYAPIRSSDPHLELVVALPLVLEQRQIAGAVGRIVDTILLSTLVLLGLLPLVSAPLARTVARPVRELVAATDKIAAGDYDTRLEPRTHDEVADLVGGFNKMASSLASQRADLERRREYMARLLRRATTGVISVDPEGRLVTLNPAAQNLLGAVADRLLPGTPLAETLAAEPQLRPLADVLEIPAEGRTVPREVDLERNHEPCRFRVVRVLLPDPAGGSSGHLILLDDVTELMRSNQLAAWAEMARAIAHEIKNPLTPIQLSTEHLRRVLHDRGVLPSEEIESCLSTVMKQVYSLRQIAGEFSTYAKLPVLETETVDPVSLMRSAVGPYKTASPQHVQIVEHYEDDAGPVAVDSRVICRALINLIENALQAMPDGGTLTVAVASLPDGRDEVALEVRDTGVGLTPEVKRRLFEPYFSTKSSGTGLGLAISRRAVEAHQGRIEVESELQTGTTMRVVLPQASV